MRLQKLPMTFRETLGASSEDVLPPNIFNKKRFVILLNEFNWLTLTERRTLEYLILVMLAKNLFFGYINVYIFSFLFFEENIFTPV